MQRFKWVDWILLTGAVAAVFWVVSNRAVKNPEPFFDVTRVNVPSNQALDQTVERRTPFNQANSAEFNSVFPLDHLVVLEQTNDSIVSTIEGLAVSGGYIYILDELSHTVMQFDHLGKFIRIVGKKGSGPFEYQNPTFIKPCWDNNIAILDNKRSRLYVFDSNGAGVQELGYPSALIPTGSFYWEDRSQLIAGDLRSPRLDDPWHAIVNPSMPDKALGFGVRPDFYDRFHFKQRFYPLSVFNNAIWAGSPYESSITLFDLKGRAIKRVNLGHPEALTYDQFDGLSASDYTLAAKMIRTKPIPHGIFPLVDAVLVDYKHFCVLYDGNGDQLAQIKRPAFSVAYSEDNFVFTVLPLLDVEDGVRPEWLDNQFPNESEMLKAMGVRIDSYDGNPVLRVGVLSI